MALSLRGAFGSLPHDGADFLIAAVLSFIYIAVFKQLQGYFDKLQRQSQRIETAFRTLQAEHEGLNNQFTSIQTQHAELVETTEISQERNMENLNRLQTIQDHLQMEYNTLQATNTAEIATLRRVHDTLQTEYATLEATKAADVRALQTAHDNLRAELDVLQTSNATLSARCRHLIVRCNHHRNQHREIVEQLERLYINVPTNTEFLFAERHELISDICLTKDGRPNLRCTRFRDLGTHILWVLHSGRRACTLIRTFAE